MAELPAQSGILDPNNLSYAFFGGGAGGTPSIQELRRRQAIAAAMAGQKRPFPKNIGEGLTSLGEAVGSRMADARLSAQERAFGAAEDARVNAASALPGVAVPGARTAPISAPPPAPAAGSVTSPDDARPEDPRARIAALYAGAASGVPPANPTVAGVTPPTTAMPAPPSGSPASDDDGLWPARFSAIGGIESGGGKDPYRTIGKAKTKYGHALGKYGVVEANVGPWSAAALGRPLTPEQFLADDKAQDAVFKHRFGQYVAKFGEEGAARAWFGGPGNVNNVNATDAYERLSIGDYGKDYLRRLQGAARTATAGAPGESGDDVGTVMTIDSATGAAPSART